MSTTAKPQQAAHHGPKVMVVSPEYCVSSTTKLIMQSPEAAAANRQKEDYHITDASGRTFFMLKAKAGSTFSAGKRQLYDAYGKPLIDVEAKMVSLHSTWLLKRSADGSRLADVKLVRSMFSKSINVFINDGDREPDYAIKGKKSFTIKDCHTNTVIAKLQKGSTFAKLTACLTGKQAPASEAQRYYLTIHPGVDTAFVTALAMCCEEIIGKHVK